MTETPAKVDIRVNEERSYYERKFYDLENYVPETLAVDAIGRTLKTAEISRFHPLSTFFSLKSKKEEKERKRGESATLFETNVDGARGVEIDLSAHWSKHTAQVLADTMRTVQTGADKQPIREHYRQAPGPVREAIAMMMGVK